MSVKAYISGLKAAFRELFLIIYAKVFGYYKNIDKLPIYNWNKLANGDYSYIYKRRIKGTPRFFKRLHLELFYQFEKVEMSGFDDILKLAYLRSLYVTTGQSRFLNKANFLEAKINSKPEGKPPKLNDMLNVIEETFKSIGQIDIYKMSTSRFYSLYYRAIEKIKHNANPKKI